MDVLAALDRRYGGRAGRLHRGPLLGLTPAAFRARWDCLCDRLGLPHRDGARFTPASLRAGGATWLYQVSGVLDAVQWRGRWTSGAMLTHYVQELPEALSRGLALAGRSVLRSELAALASVLLAEVPPMP